MEKQKLIRLYICCGKKDKIRYRKKLKKMMKRPLLFTEDLYGCNKCMVIGQPDREMQKDIIKAKKLDLEIQNLSIEEFESATFDQELFTDKQNAARNYSREYEL